MPAATAMPSSINVNPSTGAAAGVPSEPVSGDSLTQFVRGFQNLLSTQGSNLMTTGAGQAEKGIASADPAIAFLTKLVSGDKAQLESATQPETDQIKEQFDQIRQLIATGPRGGGTASAMVKAPTEEIKQIADVKAQMQKGAAGQLGNLATTLAGLGISEAGLGLGAEAEAGTIAMERRGQNVQENAATQQMIAGLGKGVGELIGGFLAGGG